MANQQSKMITRGNFYYKYVHIWNRTTKKTKSIPFKLTHIGTTEEEKIVQFKLADVRKKKIEKKALELKREGRLDCIQEWSPEWANESNTEEWKKPLTLKEGVEIYINKIDKLRRNSTIKMNLNSLVHWTTHLGANKVLNEITTKDLTAFVVRFKKDDNKPEEKGKHSDTSINMNLRNLRTLLIFLNDEGETQIDFTKVKFKNALKECPINDKDPIYISEVEFNKIMSEEWCLLYSSKREWYKKVFKLYWDLGLRLSEPFKGVIKGNYLHIPESVAKNGEARDIRINHNQKAIIEQIQSKYFESNMSKDHIKNYSKVFKKALKHCKIDNFKHFHSLRHSFGIRRRIETNGNIHQVQIEMGHKSIDTTMKYLRCDTKKLRDDFPTYRKVLDMLKNGHLNINSTRNHLTSKVEIHSIDRRQIN